MVLLGLAVTCIAGGLLIATGVIPTGNISALNVVLPLGAIFFGMHVLSRCLEKESDHFLADQESAIRATDAFGEKSGPTTRKH